MNLIGILGVVALVAVPATFVVFQWIVAFILSHGTFQVQITSSSDYTDSEQDAAFRQPPRKPCNKRLSSYTQQKEIPTGKEIQSNLPRSANARTPNPKDGSLPTTEEQTLLNVPPDKRLLNANRFERNTFDRFSLKEKNENKDSVREHAPNQMNSSRILAKELLNPRRIPVNSSFSNRIALTSMNEKYAANSTTSPIERSKPVQLAQMVTAGSDEIDRSQDVTFLDTYHRDAIFLDTYYEINDPTNRIDTAKRVSVQSSMESTSKLLVGLLAVSIRQLSKGQVPLD